MRSRGRTILMKQTRLRNPDCIYHFVVVVLRKLQFDEIVTIALLPNPVLLLK